MFDFNCFVFGWFCALVVIAIIEKRASAFVVCLFGAVVHAAILWRYTTETYIGKSKANINDLFEIRE